jgi:hypothetical protein
MRELHLHFLPILAAAIAKMAPGTLDSKSRIAEQQVRQGLPKALVVDFIGSLSWPWPWLT